MYLFVKRIFLLAIQWWRATFMPILSKFPLLDKFERRQRSPIFHNPGQLCSPGFGKQVTKWKRNKIVVFGLPKSGNVWVMSLLADCFDLPSVAPWTKEGLSHAGSTILHTPFSNMILYRRDFLFGVYLIRDIRDVITSFFHYSQTDFYRENADRSCYYNDIESFYFDYFLSKLVPRYNWLEHAEAYVSRGVPLLRYENLFDDPTRELQQLFKRWGLVVAEGKIEESVGKNSFTSLKEAGKQAFVKVPSTHFRRGGYGHYAECLTSRVLDDIQERFGGYLKRWGYGANPPPPAE